MEGKGPSHLEQTFQETGRWTQARERKRRQTEKDEEEEVGGREGEGRESRPHLNKDDYKQQAQADAAFKPGGCLW